MDVVGMDYDFATMSDEQLLQTCRRLDSRCQMLFTLLSDLENEKNALHAQRNLLHQSIAQVEESISAEAAESSMEKPESFQLPVLNPPEKLQLTVCDSTIELTWSWQQLNLQWRSLRFEVQQLSDGAGGRQRARTFQCEGSNSGEHGCTIDSWTRGKAYSFQVRACVEVCSSSNGDLWTAISSAFCEPAALPANPTSLQQVASTQTDEGLNPRNDEVKVEMAQLASMTQMAQMAEAEAAELRVMLGKSELELAESRREATQAEMATEKAKAEVAEEKKLYHEVWVSQQEQSCELMALKEEFKGMERKWRSECEEVTEMKVQHTEECNEWTQIKQKVQIEEAEMRGRLQEELIRRAAEKEEQTKLSEINVEQMAHLRMQLELWKCEEHQCAKQLEQVTMEKERGDQTIHSFQESVQQERHRFQELQEMMVANQVTVTSSPTLEASRSTLDVGSSPKWSRTLEPAVPNGSSGPEDSSLPRQEVPQIAIHQQPVVREMRSTNHGVHARAAVVALERDRHLTNSYSSYSDVLGPTIVQLPRQGPDMRIGVEYQASQYPYAAAPAAFCQGFPSSQVVELPPPPRSAPSRELRELETYGPRSVERASFVLSMLASENRWETFHFSDGGLVSLEQQAFDFLKDKKLKAALAPGLAAKMKQMVQAGLMRSSVDIVDLI